MPCGDKWKNKTMRRIPMGMGYLYGNQVGILQQDASGLVTYMPGCPPVVQEGLSLNYGAMQDGYYVPRTIRGAVPVPPAPSHQDHDPRRFPPHDHHHPWWEKDGHCCESCAKGHPCEGGCGHACTCGKEGPGVGSQPKRKLIKRKYTREGMGACVTVGDPHRQPGRRGAPGTRPSGLYYGFQRNNHASGRPNRRAPFPVGQQPYFLGKTINTYIEPFAGCPTRSAPYWVQGMGGRGRTLRSRRQLTRKSTLRSRPTQTRGVDPLADVVVLLFPQGRGHGWHAGVCNSPSPGNLPGPCVTYPVTVSQVRENMGYVTSAPKQPLLENRWWRIRSRRPGTR